MGTRGYKVYRWKGHYFVYYNHWDSYPSAFGLKVLGEIPTGLSEDEFEDWVASKGRYLDGEFVRLQGESEDSRDYVTEEQPVNDLFIEWIYEIDLDNRVFHVDSNPLFRLDCLPPDDVFLEAISFDHFGHRAYNESSPQEYRYDWRASPPTPDAGFLEVYTSSCDKLSSTPIHNVLGVPQELSAPERSRARLMEVAMLRILEEHNLGHELRVLESVSSRDHISDDIHNLANFLIKLSMFLPISGAHRSRESGGGFQWFGNNLCLFMTTHLDETKNLQASIGALIHHIQSTPRDPGVIFGIACSMFHCVVLRVDGNAGQYTFKHSPALQFLPSFYASTAWTPGLEALSRLAQIIAVLQLRAYIGETRGAMSLPVESTKILPIELWSEICSYIALPIDLINLAVVFPETKSVIIDLLQYPFIKGNLLKDATGPAPSPIHGPDTDSKRLRVKFRASSSGRIFELNVGVRSSSWIQNKSWSSVGSDDLDYHVIFEELGLYDWEGS